MITNSTLAFLSADCVTSGGGKLLTGSCEGHLRQWAVQGVGQLRLPGVAGGTTGGSGLTMEDEMTLDGAIISACFDDNLEMVCILGCIGCQWLMFYPFTYCCGMIACSVLMKDPVSGQRYASRHALKF